MLRFILVLSLLLGAAASARAQGVAELVGRYRLEQPQGDILELRADGSASMAGEETSWSVSGNQLSLGTEVMLYTLQEGRLLLSLGPLQLSLVRLDGGAKAPRPSVQKPPGGVRAQPGAGAEDADREARQVLTGSAWCAFTYNKVSGTTTTRRVVFRPDGVMTVTSGAETYSSGYGGTYSGQSGSTGSLRWKLENLRLYLDQQDGAGFQDIGLTATRNSNGYPLLHALGQEYSMCK